MTHTLTRRLQCLLVSLLILAACDENPVTTNPTCPVDFECPEPPDPSPPTRKAKFSYEGDAVARLVPGRTQTLVYYVWESGGAAIDVSVVEMPKRATYKVTDTDGDSGEDVAFSRSNFGIPKKKITVVWTPDTAAEGEYPLTIRAGTITGSAQRFFHFKLYVQNPDGDP